MTSIFKKSALAIALCGLASTSYADLITGFFGGIEGGYLQARNGDLSYLAIPPQAVGGVTTDLSLPTNNQQWAYRLFGGLTFCGGDDFTFSYLRFHTNDFARYQNAGEQLFLAPRWLPVAFAGWDQIISHVTFNLDDYYGVFGHTMRIAEPWHLRVGFGLEYARLDSDMFVKAHSTIVAPFRQYLGYTATNGDRGIGPRLDVDLAYALPYSLGVFAKSNAALLVSHRNIGLHTVDPLAGTFPDFNFGQRTVVIPKIGMKVGAGYYFTYAPVGGEGAAMAVPSTTFGLEAGWEGEVFVHAIERPDPIANIVQTAVQASPAAFNYKTHVSNYAYQGPFLTATLATNWL